MKLTEPVRSSPLRWSLVIAAALVALAVPASGARAADGPAFGLRVANGDNPRFLNFRSAQCFIRRRHSFEALAHDRGWRLLVGIRPFTGFHRYQLVRGRYNGTYLDLLSPGGVEYASDFIPPFHIPSGGQLNFAQHGNLLGGGFAQMFDESGTDGVDVGGVLRCRYPKHGRRR